MFRKTVRKELQIMHLIHKNYIYPKNYIRTILIQKYSFWKPFLMKSTPVPNICFADKCKGDFSWMAKIIFLLLSGRKPLYFVEKARIMTTKRFMDWFTCKLISPLFNEEKTNRWSITLEDAIDHLITVELETKTNIECLLVLQ